MSGRSERVIIFEWFSRVEDRYFALVEQAGVCSFGEAYKIRYLHEQKYLWYGIRGSICVGVPSLPEFKYSFAGFDPLTHIRASRREVDVSPKAAREVCSSIRGMRLSDAKKFLEEVITLRKPVAFRRYKRKAAHRSGLSKFHAGAYPVKAAKKVLEVLENLEANSDFMGRDTDRLKIIHAAALRGRVVKAYTPRAMGRSSPSFNTLVHIEVVAKEA